MSDQQHKQICKDLHMTYLMKNADYGDSFKKSLDEDGLIAAVVRMRDKVNRLKSLKDKVGQVSDETLSDTALDLANYAIMTAMWIEDSGRRTEQWDLFRTGEEVGVPFDNAAEIKAMFGADFDGDCISIDSDNIIGNEDDYPSITIEQEIDMKTINDRLEFLRNRVGYLENFMNDLNIDRP